MLALAVAVAMPQGTARSPERTLTFHVHYENAGANAGTVLSDVARLANVRLAASPETAGEVLAVRFQGESLDVVMKRIAWAVDGSWKPRGDGFLLFRSGEQLHAEEKREMGLRVAAYRAGIEKMRKEVEETPELTVDAAGKIAHSLAVQAASNGDGPQKPPPVRERRPVGRAVARLSLLLDPRELADIPAVCKVAYATQPTHAQRPFSVEALQVMAEFGREQTRWMDAASTLQIPTVAASPSAFDASNIGGAMLTAAKVGAENDYVQLLLRIADRNGRVLARAILPIVPGPIADSVSPQLRNASDLPLAVPPEVAEIVRAANGITRPALPAATRSQACNPVQYDPLGLATGRLLILAAASKHRSLVADLADSMLVPPTDGKQIRAGEFIDGVTAMTAERSADTEWIGIRPILAAQARANRADRAALGRLLRRCAEPRPPNVDELAALSLDLPPAASNGMPWILRGLVSASTTVEYFDDRVLRFYGQLDETQRSIALQRGLRMDALAPGAATMLAAILTEPDTTLDLTPQRGVGAGNLPTAPMGPIMHEPTQSLPDGIPGTGIVHIEVSQQEVAGVKQTTVGDAWLGAEAFTAQDLGRRKFLVDHPDPDPERTIPRQHYDRLLLGSRTRYLITYQFTPEVSLTCILASADFGDEREISFDDLPESFRKAADASYARLSEQFKIGQPRSPQPARPPIGGTPPPKIFMD